MSEQATWVPLPRRRGPKAKLPAVLERANRLIDWYEVHKPEVRRLTCTVTDYDAFEEAANDPAHSARLRRTGEGIIYRGILMYVADR